MRRPAVKKIDAVRLLAKASFGDRRRSPARILVTLGVVAGLLGMLVWSVWPRPTLPPLLMSAFDQVALPGETVFLSAAVEPIDGDSADIDLTGCELFFLDLRTQEVLAKVATKRNGVAQLSRQFAAAERPVEIMVRYRGEESRMGVFIWPADSPLLVVDADHTLADVEEEKLWTLNNLDIRPVAGAAKALQAARAKYRVVYLSGSADRPSRYRKLRALLGRGERQGQFPDGPLVARAGGPAESDTASFQQSVLTDLKQRFRGEIVGIAKRGEEAQLFRRAGLDLFLVGDADGVREGVTRIKSWSDLAGQLPTKP